MSVGQWSSSVDCWLALFLLLRAFSRLRALVARCRICALVWIGMAEKGLGVVLGGRGVFGLVKACCGPLRGWVGKYHGGRCYPGVWGCFYKETRPLGRS